MSKFIKTLKLIPTVFFIFCSLRFAEADTLYLKNGRSIEGLIKSEDEDNLELEIYAGTVTFKKSQIERIEKSDAEEAQAIRKTWQRQRIDVQTKALERRLEEQRRPKEVEFQGEWQGIMVDAILNKRLKTSLILDTGSSLVVLKRSVAQNLGIKMDRAQPDIKMSLADGRQVNAKYIILESIQTEGIEEKNVPAAVLLDEAADLGLSDGLLGMSFLERFNFKVDRKNRKLILERL